MDLNEKKIRILHAPTNTGNNPWAISRAERQLGLASDLVVFESHKFYEHCDYNLDLPYFSLPGEFKKWLFLAKNWQKYDIFHFNFGFSFLDYPFGGLDYLDLAFLKKHGKKIVMTYQGDDARQKDYFLARFGRGPYPSQKRSIIDFLADWRKRARITKIGKLADHIFALNPDLLYVLPKRAEFMPYAIEKSKIQNPNFQSNSKSQAQNNKKIIIVHAPSHRFAKGTEYILPVIDELKEKYPIEFILVENMTNLEAQKIYQKADIAIDQLIIGWYGAFAVEMMARGVPTVCYLRIPVLKKFVPFYREIPIVNANKDNLKKKLVELIENAVLREMIGRASRQFASDYHAPAKIAVRTKQVYEDLVKTKNKL